MKKKYIIGIDSGTQSTRAIIFDFNGNIVCSGRAKHPDLIKEKPGYAVHDYNDIFNGLCGACNDMFDQFSGSLDEIAGIGISGQRGTTIQIDNKGNQVCRPISWMDLRWRENEENEKSKNEDLWKYYLSSYSRMNWLNNNDVETKNKVHKYLTVTGYLCYCLCGTFVDTLGNNLGMPVDREKWKLYDENDDIYNLMGLKKEQLAEFVKPGQVMGYITKEASKKTGLPENCPVIAGAGDKQCEVLGGGATRKGQAYITLGTMSGLTLVDENYIQDAYKKKHFRTYTAAVPNTWHAEASAARGFWLVSWFRDNLAEGLLEKAKSEGCKSIEAFLDKEAEKIPAGAEGLIATPDWKPTWDKPYAKGMFIGFDMRHTRAHLFRALIEGIIMQLKINSDIMCDETGLEIKEIIVGGGGSQSSVALQAIADIFGVSVKRSHEVETCSLGAAICAAVGVKEFSSFEEAVKNMNQSYDLFKPKEANQLLYSRLIKNVIRSCYSANEELLQSLEKIV